MLGQWAGIDRCDPRVHGPPWSFSHSVSEKFICLACPEYLSYRTFLLSCAICSKFWDTLSFSALVATITVFSVVNQLGITQSELYVRVFMQHR
jgi:hypothetical protein